MLRSLERLRGGINVTLDVAPDEVTQRIYCEIADDIQAEVDEKYILRDEVDKFYLPRPLFEDGEPVQIGDYVDLQREGMRHVQVTDIRPWIVYGNSTFHQREPYKRPPEPDTQEKIDADLLLTGREYCVKHGLDYEHQNVLSFVVARRDLLARQRKLDGVE